MQKVRNIGSAVQKITCFSLSFSKSGLLSPRDLLLKRCVETIPLLCSFSQVKTFSIWLLSPYLPHQNSPKNPPVRCCIHFPRDACIDTIPHYHQHLHFRLFSSVSRRMPQCTSSRSSLKSRANSRHNDSICSLLIYYCHRFTIGLFSAYLREDTLANSLICLSFLKKFCIY